MANFMDQQDALELASRQRRMGRVTGGVSDNLDKGEDASPSWGRPIQGRDEEQRTKLRAAFLDAWAGTRRAGDWNSDDEAVWMTVENWLQHRQLVAAKTDAQAKMGGISAGRADF